MEKDYLVRFDFAIKSLLRDKKNFDILEGFIEVFLNKITQYYEPCYSKCKTCKFQGNDEINNCTSCKKNYILRPDIADSTNCVKECKFYYYINFGQYLCTENNQCPTEASLLIKDKKRCIDNCTKDDTYKFQYNYDCLEKCPEETNADEENICRIINKKKCYLYSDYLINVNYKELESKQFDILVKRYITGFNDTDFHVDFYRSNNYSITIYRTMECLRELEMNTTIKDFGECYGKVQEKYKFIGRNLIILIADFFNGKILENTLFYFFNPDTGAILPIDEVCNNQSFTIEKSLAYYSEINMSQAKFFGDQNIDIFNTNDVFYNDLCFFFKSPNNKDVPLKERLLLFYPNITLCEDSCNNAGVNLTSMKAICECKLKELLDETKEATKLVGIDYTDLIDSLSLDVLKCYKTLFQYKYFINCYGGFISIILIIAQSICAIITARISVNKIRRTAFNLLGSYSNLLRSQTLVNNPIKKKVKRSYSMKLVNDSKSVNNSKYKASQKSFKKPLKSEKKLLFSNRKRSQKSMATINDKISNKKTKISKVNKNKNLNNSELYLIGDINLKEYLMTSMNELDFDELIEREKRPFCRMYFDRLLVHQMIIDLLFNNNWIIPKTIKIIFFIVMIDLYFVVNALFYNEAYIRDLYYLEEEETFFSFVPRSLNRIIYTSLASTVLDFIISLLFPTENKIKKILIRKKNNRREMRNKVFISMKNIINNYWIFILISYILTIFSWYYISCFNNVYPYLKMEWIKSSIFILFVMQIITLLGCLLFTFLRYLSIKCKSEKLFRISNYFFS